MQLSSNIGSANNFDSETFLPLDDVLPQGPQPRVVGTEAVRLTIDLNSFMLTLSGYFSHPRARKSHKYQESGTQVAIDTVRAPICSIIPSCQEITIGREQG